MQLGLSQHSSSSVRSRNLKTALAIFLFTVCFVGFVGAFVLPLPLANHFMSLKKKRPEGQGIPLSPSHPLLPVPPPEQPRVLTSRVFSQLSFLGNVLGATESTDRSKTQGTTVQTTQQEHRQG